MRSDIILKYFPGLNQLQKSQFEKMYELYSFWNAQINVISRKDFDLLYERHILHSLGIAKVLNFMPSTKVLDVGTGGGFPGIPLAVLFPETSFHLVDSIGKKIKVVEGVAKGLGLNNVTAQHERAEKINGRYHFIVSRAVTEFPEFYNWIHRKILKENFNDLPNGVLYLKGGDLKEEFGPHFTKTVFYELKKNFEEEFFETKKVAYYKLGFV